MTTLARRIMNTWGPWLVAPCALLVTTLPVCWYALTRCGGNHGMAFGVLFAALVAIVIGVLSLLLTLTCRLPVRWQRYLGRIIYGISIIAQAGLLLVSLLMAM